MAEPKVKAPVVSDSEFDRDSRDTGKILAAQEKVKVKLHLAPDRKRELEAQEATGKQIVWPYETVSVNGYNYQIQLGKTVEVPQTVAEILEQAGLI